MSELAAVTDNPFITLARINGLKKVGQTANELAVTQYCGVFLEIKCNDFCRTQTNKKTVIFSSKKKIRPDEN